MSTRGETITVAADTRYPLELRFEAPEQPEGAETHDPAVIVPWPLNPSEIFSFYMNSPWLGAIGNLLGDAVQSASWDLSARETDLEGNLIRRGAAWRREQDQDFARAKAWLSRPHMGREGVSHLDIHGLLKAMSVAYDQNANIFVELVRNEAASEPAQINHLLPQYVWYRARETREGKRLELYQVDPFRGEFAFVPFGQRPAGDRTGREFLHQRQPNTVSSFYGVPQWYPSKESVETDNEHRRYLKNFFKRHTTPRYMILITQDPEWQGPEPDQKDRESVYNHVRNFLQANAGDMAGRNLILQYPGGIIVKAEALDNKLEDPTFPETRRAMRDEILAVRHISLSNLGSPEATNRATAEEHSMNFRKEVLEPFAAPAVAILNEVLHADPPHGLGVQTYDFVLSFERVDDLLQRIKAVVDAVGGPVLTVPEGRQMLGYESRGEDVIYIPTNVIPGMPEMGGPDGGENE